MDLKETNIISKPFYSIGITDLVYFTKRSGDLKIDLSTYGRQRLMGILHPHQKVATFLSVLIKAL
jgi:hypothetical protein